MGLFGGKGGNADQAREANGRWKSTGPTAGLMNQDVADNPYVTGDSGDADYLQKLHDIAKVAPYESLLGELARHEHPFVRMGAARNPNLTDRAVHDLALDSDAGVRRLAASHPNLAEQSQVPLAQDPDWQVRNAVTNRADALGGVLRLSVYDDNANVRMSAAAHPKTREEHLVVLGGDEDEQVRAMARMHPRYPNSQRSLLEKLQYRSGIGSIPNPAKRAAVA